MKKLVVALIVLFAASGASAGMTGLGIGIHGGIVNGYDNPALETGIENGLFDYFQDSLSAVFDMPDDMKNFGAVTNNLLEDKKLQKALLQTMIKNGFGKQLLELAGK